MEGTPDKDRMLTHCGPCPHRGGVPDLRRSDPTDLGLPTLRLMRPSAVAEPPVVIRRRDDVEQTKAIFSRGDAHIRAWPFSPPIANKTLVGCGQFLPFLDLWVFLF